MSSDLHTTVTGNLVSAVNIRFNESGTAYARFRIAHNRRIYDAAAQAWVDGETTYLDVKCWGRLAENVAESLEKGMPVVVTGRLAMRSVEEKSGEQSTWRNYVDLVAAAVGPDLARGTAKFQRTRSQGVATVEARAIAEAQALGAAEASADEAEPTAAA